MVVFVKFAFLCNGDFPVAISTSCSQLNSVLCVALITIAVTSHFVFESTLESIKQILLLLNYLSKYLSLVFFFCCSARLPVPLFFDGTVCYLYKPSQS